MTYSQIQVCTQKNERRNTRVNKPYSYLDIPGDYHATEMLIQCHCRLVPLCHVQPVFGPAMLQRPARIGDTLW